MSVKTIGILGAGKLGITLAQLAIKAGYRVYIAGSGSPDKIALSVKVLTPGAVAATSEAVVKAADVVVLAFPLSKFRDIPREAFDGTLVIDAINHWWEVDGPRDDSVAANLSSSQAIQEYIPNARVVKALNHMGYHDLYGETKPAGQAGRKGIAVAGDNRVDVAIVSDVINNLGFDPVYIGNLAAGQKLEPGGKVFGVNVSAKELKRLLAV